MPTVAMPFLLLVIMDLKRLCPSAPRPLPDIWGCKLSVFNKSIQLDIIKLSFEPLGEQAHFMIQKYEKTILITALTEDLLFLLNIFQGQYCL